MIKKNSSDISLQKKESDLLRQFVDDMWELLARHKCFDRVSCSTTREAIAVQSMTVLSKEIAKR